MMAMVTKNMQKSIDENLASRNVSGGGISSQLTSSAIGDISAELGYSDYSRAMQGRYNMLGLGTNSLSTAGQLALGKSGAHNQYNLGAGNLNLGYDELEFSKEKWEAEQEASKSNAWTDILSAGIGAAGNIYGMNILGSALKKD